LAYRSLRVVRPSGGMYGDLDKKNGVTELPRNLHVPRISRGTRSRIVGDAVPYFGRPHAGHGMRTQNTLKCVKVKIFYPSVKILSSQDVNWSAAVGLAPPSPSWMPGASLAMLAARFG
jgi:hypothetical protein